MLHFIFIIFTTAVYSLDIYIRPFSENYPCSISGGFIPCDGSFINPYDNLAYAFVSGVAAETSEGSLNFYLQASGPIILNSTTQNNSTVSPFKDYGGPLIIKKIR